MLGVCNVTTKFLSKFLFNCGAPFYHVKDKSGANNEISRFFVFHNVSWILTCVPDFGFGQVVDHVRESDRPVRPLWALLSRGRF